MPPATAKIKAALLRWNYEKVETEMNLILIVEDEEHIAEGLRFNLELEGYQAVIAPDGETALQLLIEEKKHFDAIVLDIMLPAVDGFTVAAALREKGIFTPILMLTARGYAEDVLRGFEAGADDYLPKPFDLNIFLARLNGLLRRRQWLTGGKPAETVNETGVYQFNGKTIDLPNLELRSAAETVNLTLMEAKLLRHLIDRNGNVVSRKEILEDVWEVHEDTDTRAIDNFIVRLRRYLEDEPSNPKHLLTVRGIGYRFLINP